MKILVIDDEVKTAKFLKKGLCEAGYVIDVAADGLEGLHLAKEVDFDLVILDCPPGISLLTENVLRAADALVDIGRPILVVTHGGSLRAAIAAAAEVAPPPIANGAIWRIEWEGAIVKAEAVESP